MKLELIKEAVENMTGTVLDSPDRKRDIVYTRFIYFKLARIHTNRSLSTIGELVGRNHATVLYGLNTFDNVICKLEPEFYEQYLLLDKRLRKRSGKTEKIINPTMYYRDKYAETLLELRKTRNEYRKISKDTENLKKQMQYLI